MLRTKTVEDTMRESVTSQTTLRSKASSSNQSTLLGDAAQVEIKVENPIYNKLSVEVKVLRSAESKVASTQSPQRYTSLELNTT